MHSAAGLLPTSRGHGRAELGERHRLAPAATAAFTTADIFAQRQRAISKRIADIGVNFQQGDLLAEITAPELDARLPSAGGIGQTQAAINQAQANLELSNT